MKPGDLFRVDARGWGEKSLTAQCHGKVALLVKRLPDSWCSLLIDGKLVTLHSLTLRLVDETR